MMNFGPVLKKDSLENLLTYFGLEYAVTNPCSNFQEYPLQEVEH